MWIRTAHRFRRGMNASGDPDRSPFMICRCFGDSVDHRDPLDERSLKIRNADPPNPGNPQDPLRVRHSLRVGKAISDGTTYPVVLARTTWFRPPAFASASALSA